MNYAWANPNNGLREQTDQSTPERMLQEAKYRVWTELQDSTKEADYCNIWCQEAIGEVTVNGPVLDMPSIAVDVWHHFAWTDPETGERVISDAFPGQEAAEQLKRLQEANDPTKSVIVYGTWPECTVHRSDPKPEYPESDLAAALESADECRGDTPGALKDDLEYVVILDDQTKCAKITAWALLDIAESMRHFRSSGTPLKNRVALHPAPRLNLWERIKHFIFGDPVEMPDCENCGARLVDPDGVICPRCAGAILEKLKTEPIESREEKHLRERMERIANEGYTGI